jgi:YHS domain-containing protein
MSGKPVLTLPPPGSQVRTACGGLVEFEQATPHAPYHGEWLFFCLPACQQLFENDPKSSCLPGQESSKDGE